MSEYKRVSKMLAVMLLSVGLALDGVPYPAASAPLSSAVRLGGHVPRKALSSATLLGRLASDSQLSVSFVLPLRNQSDLQELLRRIYDPADPLYGHYLMPEEFTDRFGPSQTDYDAVIGYARSMGLTISETYPNRLLLKTTAPAGGIEHAFNVHFQRYQTAEGREIYSADDDPEVPSTTAARIVGMIGLDNAAVRRAHSRFVAAADPAQRVTPLAGSGPAGGMSPGDILSTYNLTSVSANGAGQVLGLFELDGYRASDVTGYVSYFGLPSVPLQNVLIDGFSGKAGSGASEVTLDIELQIALAPGASRIIVYEGPNTDAGVVDTYNRIATDNLAKQISTSWGLSEGESSAAVISSENAAFQQMAAQGQSIYAASGDSGAYDNGSTLSVDDPASQPYMVGVGGTRLTINPDKSYNYETVWNSNNTISGGAGGGGVSSLWSIPVWQQGITSLSSATMRNVPDVSLNSDPNTGYSIYYRGGWYVFGGTSCAAPLWAAFNARVNQQRVLNGNSTLGFANPALYTIARGTNFGVDFHDVTQGTNLYYSAAAGYDSASGWGSFNGAKLLAELAPVTTYTLSYASAGNGTISGATSQTVSWGGSGSQVTAVASNGYHFVAWSDGLLSAARTDTNVTANLSVMANFDVDPYVQIAFIPQIYYGLLQSAYDAAASGALIKAQELSFSENLNVDKPTAVTLSGGWDATFSNQNGYTVLRGVLTISRGKFVADHLIIH